VVLEDKAAQAAGLMKGDVILANGGSTIVGHDEYMRALEWI